jgi:ABC-type uncharacterized transport system ATPase subunit
MNENLDSSTRFERYHLLNHIYTKIYDYKKNIKPSPNPYYMLEKYYGKRPVVKKVSIEVNRGEIVGLLGPNGAGKTTTFYMLVGFIRPDAGKVFLGDEICA